jgi:uncharacterized protein (TIGR02996 family)
MPAWLELTSPSSGTKKIELPANSGRLIFGRSRTCTVVIDDLRVAKQHCQVAFENGHWHVRDLGSLSGILVNGVKAPGQHLLDGDVFEFVGVRVVFRDPPVEEDARFIQAIESDPTANEPWLVYADRLQELGDPLGERMICAHQKLRVDHAPWLKDLWSLMISGQLELEFHFGFIQKAVLRPMAGQLNVDVVDALRRLFHLRIGRFLQTLVVERGSPEACEDLQTQMIQFQVRPTLLSHFSCGARFGTPLQLFPLPAFEAIFPKLQSAPIWHQTPRFRLQVLERPSGIQITGVTEHGRALIQGVVTRVRRDGKHMHFETPTVGRHQLDGDPTYFATQENGQPVLVTGRLKTQLKVNGRTEAIHYLLPGDRISVAGSTLAFELPAAS